MGIKGQSSRADQTPRLRLPRTGAVSGVVAGGVPGEASGVVATGVGAVAMGGTVGMPDSAPRCGVREAVVANDVDGNDVEVPGFELSGAEADPLSPPPPHAANPASRTATPERRPATRAKGLRMTLAVFMGSRGAAARLLEWELSQSRKPLA